MRCTYYVPIKILDSSTVLERWVSRKSFPVQSKWYGADKICQIQFIASVTLCVGVTLAVVVGIWNPSLGACGLQLNYKSVPLNTSSQWQPVSFNSGIAEMLIGDSIGSGFGFSYLRIAWAVPTRLCSSGFSLVFSPSSHPWFFKKSLIVMTYLYCMVRNNFDQFAALGISSHISSLSLFVDRLPEKYWRWLEHPKVLPPVKSIAFPATALCPRSVVKAWSITVWYF